jgi:hypothetical protein
MYSAKDISGTETEIMQAQNFMNAFGKFLVQALSSRTFPNELPPQQFVEGFFNALQNKDEN